MPAALVNIVFTPSGKRGQVERGSSVLQAAQQLGVDLDTMCGGRGICDRCQIDHSVGQFAKLKMDSEAGHLSPPSAAERAFFPPDSPPGRRLGCQAKLLGDVVIDIPPESQAHRQVVRKQLDSGHLNLNPAVRLYPLNVAEPNMHEPSGDLERLFEAIEFAADLSDLRCDPELLPQIQDLLRASDWQVTAAIAAGRDLIALWPGHKSTAYGIAVDVGSTTIAAHLCDLSSGQALASNGRMNPQIRFGEDLMSRVSYAMLNEGGAAAMTESVREALAELMAELIEQTGLAADEVLDVVLVGNPIMHHLLLGLDPVPLGSAPFALATDSAVNMRARDLGLALNPGARLYLLPCIAGHVGADAAAAVLAEAPHTGDARTLLVDIGTNAELVFGNRERLVAASSPTGPAFEGAQLSCGQRAAPGAIERVRIDEQGRPKVRIIGSAVWSDEKGFAKAAAATGVTGICGSGIIEALAELYLAEILLPDGNFDGTKAGDNPHLIPDGKVFAYLLYEDAKHRITITQNDVRAIQLAKAALAAGAYLLVDKLNGASIDRIRLAGAFGAHIDVKHAMVLGLLPDCELDMVSPAGNAAGTGATIALLDIDARREIEQLVRRIEKVETAVEAKFQDYFVAALAIPHASEPFSKLRESVPLPAAPQQTRQRGQRRSRRAAA